ncbi:MAG: zinc ribbon domain-containing protein [Ideonella sp.]|nr:zinc ribbon domain-containing protein [Ideonella sp.]MCC7459312.1 zinc ribbon domain-containing protein [Nitrospira sp.]
MAEARFCSECGAALLRRFCPVCHAVNEADSHFCQSCGASLPTSPAAHAPAPMPPPDSIPSLTDVAFLEPGAPGLATAVAPPEPAGVVMALPPQLPTVTHAAKAPKVEPKLLYRVPALLGVGGVAALLVAVVWWPRLEPRVQQPEPAPAREAAAPPAIAEAALPTARETVSTSAHGANGRGAAAAALPVVGEAAAKPAPPASAINTPTGSTTTVASPQAPAIARSGDKAMPRRSPAEVIIAVQPPPAAPADRRAARPVPKPAPTTPAAPATPAAPTYECTPQVDALGLCAPGAKVSGR